MSLIRGKNWWWAHFKHNLFALFSHIKGNITLGHGFNEIEIQLDKKLIAKRVFVALESENIQVCAGNVDMVGSILNGNNTFIIYADIKSNSAVVYWLVEYGVDNDDNEESIDNI